MWSLEIIDLTPGIEGVLRLGEIAEAAQREHLGVECAVEALVFAAALRVIGTTVNNRDASLRSHTANRVQRSPDGSPQGVPLSTKNASGRP